MGQFSFMFADTFNTENLLECGEAFVACPDGSVIHESCYDGYGDFDGFDIYDLVADWNRDHIGIEDIKKPDRNNWEQGEKGDNWYGLAVKRYERSVSRMKDFISHKPDSYMDKTYGKNWKREIGIDIACYDEDNARLEYPIKICKNEWAARVYDKLPSSNSDPNQGWEPTRFSIEDVLKDTIKNDNAVINEEPIPANEISAYVNMPKKENERQHER